MAWAAALTNPQAGDDPSEGLKRLRETVTPIPAPTEEHTAVDSPYGDLSAT
jgi:hypothetical protein